MYRWLFLAAVVLGIAAAPAAAGGLTGQYIEARTCDVWTGACFGNAEMNLAGKHAVIGWKVEKGTLDDATLDGLSVVAVVAATDTIGLEQNGPARALLIVDARADAAQRQALIKLARQLGGDWLRRVVAVETATVKLTVGEGKDAVVARLAAGEASIQTRALDKERDRACGGEGEFYAPLSRNVKAQVAVAAEHSYVGKRFRETWKQADRRSAYVGKFELP